MQEDAMLNTNTINVSVPGVMTGRALESIKKTLETEGIEAVFSVLNSGEIDENRAYSLEEAFPDSHPGKALAGLRMREGLTQKQMAESLSISQSRLSELERGIRRITIDMAKKAADIYGISHRSLL
jgi:antitoxin component HigA of HigAB toxin-antitoxin module